MNCYNDSSYYSGKKEIKSSSKNDKQALVKQ